MTRNTYLFTALAALAALAMIAFGAPDAHNLVAYAAGGLQLANFMPAMMERKSDLDDDNPVAAIKSLIEAQGAAWNEFKSSNAARFEQLEAQIDGIALKAARPGGLGGMLGGVGDVTPSQRKALDTAVRALLTGNQDAAYKAFTEAKAMSVGTDPNGGYLVVPEMSPRIERVMLEASPLLNEVRIVELTATDEWEELVDIEEAEAVWIGEVSTRNETATPGLKKFSAPVHEIYAQPKVTQKLIDTTSYDVVGWLSDKIGEKFGFSFGAAIASGNGIAKPAGFLTYPTLSTGDSTRAWGKLQHIPTGTSGALSATVPTDVLDDTIATLKTQYRKGAKWYMSRTTAATLAKLKDDNGQKLWQPSMAADKPPTLLGYEVVEDDNMPAIAADSLSIGFGNLRRAYVMVRRLGTRFLLDPYTDKPNVKVYAYQRVGGGLANTEAFKLIKFGTS